MVVSPVSAPLVLRQVIDHITWTGFQSVVYSLQPWDSFHSWNNCESRFNMLFFSRELGWYMFFLWLKARIFPFVYIKSNAVTSCVVKQPLCLLMATNSLSDIKHRLLTFKISRGWPGTAIHYFTCSRSSTCLWLFQFTGAFASLIKMRLTNHARKLSQNYVLDRTGRGLWHFFNDLCANLHE